MAVLISNLVIGLDKGLDSPRRLLDMAAPFGNQVGLEFFIHTCYPEYMGHMAHIKEWTGEMPLALHGPFLGVEAASRKGTPEYEYLVGAYTQAFAQAKAFGVGHVVFHDHERYVKPEEKQELQAVCLDNIRTLICLGQEYGVRLLLENLALPVKGTPLFDQREYMELFTRFPEVDCLIDIGHLELAGWDMEAVISGLKDRIRGYHLHNNDGREDSHRRIGDGVISYEAFFRLYRRFTPAADLTLEYGDGHGITTEDVRRDVELVLNKIQG